jgi:hypothetical protein
MTKLYQNIPLEGVEWQNPIKEHSKFWNEGKWDNFVAPFLPEDCSDQTFVDMGCNAGLFLKLAKDAGYRNVIGVEKDTTPVNEGLRYRDSIGYDYKILKRTLGTDFGGEGTFNIDELPLADITIMSTFHYYIYINTWLKYLDRLRSKTRQVLLISRPRMKRLHWKAYSSLEELRNYFSEWNEVGYLDKVSSEGDPSPRSLFTVVFESPLLERVSMDSIGIREDSDNTMYVAIMDLAHKVAEEGELDPFQTDYYNKWVNRKKDKWSDSFIREFVTNKYKMLLDVKENGLKDPIIIQKDGKISDGGHRWAILKALNYKSVLVRRI